jgi:F-type H+-transporting ATPase subunit delta
MANGSLARRYARALIGIGTDENCIDQIGADLAAFDQVLDLGDGALRSALSNPGVTTGEQRAVMEQVLSKLSLHKHVGSFLRLLVDKNRFAAFSEILTAYTQMADEIAGRVRATVTTASKQDTASQKQIRSAIESATGKKVDVGFEVDETLIGGVVAKIGDTVIDASIRSRLQELRAELVHSGTDA